MSMVVSFQLWSILVSTNFFDKDVFNVESILNGMWV